VGALANELAKSKLVKAGAERNYLSGERKENEGRKKENVEAEERRREGRTGQNPRGSKRGMAAVQDSLGMERRSGLQVNKRANYS
jgi:hypothetical protein